MSGGYDRFFKEAQKAKGLADTNGPKFKLEQRQSASPSPSLSRRRQQSPEDRLREELTRRIRLKKRAAMKRKKMPVYPIVVAGIMFAACSLVYRYSDQLDQWLQKIEIGAFGSARAAESDASVSVKEGPAKAEKAAGSAKSSHDAHASAAKSAESKDAAASPEDAGAKRWTAEEVSFFSKLNERKKELDLREAELAKLEEELQKRKQELDEKIKTLEAMRGEISKTLAARVSNDQAKVDKLVQFYSGMKPAQAAKVIETLNEDLAIEVLDKMKKKNAAEILDVMDAKKARRLSELLTGYQRSTASDGAAFEKSAPEAQDAAKAEEGEGT